MKKIVRRGFTLPEILVTVTVVAVLAAVVVPAVTQYVNKGDAPSSSADIDQVRNAITGYIADTRKYPTSFYDLVSNSAVNNWKGPYFSSSLSGSTSGVQTFVSNGANITLGPSISQTGTFLTTPVQFNSGASCKDLTRLKTLIDPANTSQSAGNLTWSGTCDDNSTPVTGLSVTLKLAPVGT